MIGLRYMRARRRNHYISFISMTSMLGIVLGVWALITVMSVMSGFHTDLKDRILFVVPHITISSAQGYLENWEGLRGHLGGFPGVEGMAPFVLGQSLLSRGKQVTGALVRGIDPQAERQVSEVLDFIVAGNASALQSGSFGIILGRYLARSLGVSVGEKVTVFVPKGRVTPAGLLPRTKRFTVVGIFEIDMYEYDSGIALVHIDDSRRLLDIDDAVSGIRLKLEDLEFARQLRPEIARTLNSAFRVRDWTQEHANFFRAIEIEKRVVFIVLLLIVAVAAFNIVSTLVMTVTDKQSDVAILRTLGMHPGRIMKIFMVQGSFIGIVGTCAGGVLGVATALNVETLVPAIERLFNTELFPIDVYVISDFPADMRWSDVSRVVVSALLMSFLATLYPSWRAAQVQPAEALRHE